MGRFFERAGFALAFLSAVSILFSIALSQVVLALSLAALLLSGKRLRFPPIRLTLALFVVVTVAALLASGDPRAGLPQIRKLFVFAILLVIYSTFETLRQVRWMIGAWGGVALFSAVLGVVQFVHRRQEANTYEFLVDGRITGFESHWMTFGGQEMIVLLTIASFLLFSERRLVRALGLPALCVLLTAVTFNMTRCIFLLGVPSGFGYLIWRRRRILILVGIAAVSSGATWAHAPFRSAPSRYSNRMPVWTRTSTEPYAGL